MSQPNPLRDIFRFAPTRPAVGAGLRAGAAAVLPLVASPLVPTEVLTFLTMGGFQTALADKGGAYRSRANAMALVLACGTSAAFLGNLVGGLPIVGLAAVFVWLLASGLAQAWGTPAAGAGTASSVVLVLALSRPATSWEGISLATAGYCSGALVALVLALVLWPVRLYRPARLSVARCWEALAQLASTLAHRDPSLASEGFEERVGRVHAQRAQLRQSVEEARNVLAGTRRGRQGESERGERLIALLENADQLLGACIAIDGWQEMAPAEERQEVAGALLVLERSALVIAVLLRNGGGGKERPPIERIGVAGEGVVGVGASSEGAASSGTTSEATIRIGAAAPFLNRLARHLEGAAEAAEGLGNGRPLRRPVRKLELPTRRTSARDALREVLDPRSVHLRHALRLALAGTAAGAIVAALRIEHGYWITITTIVILKPWTSASLQRGVQRIAGTVIGSVIAIGAVALVSDRLMFVAIVFVLCSASVALLPVNYGVFSVLLTPAFVLVAELGTGDYGLAWVRVVDTLIGGGIALLAARLLWPSWERHRFPEELSIALGRSAAWMRQLAGSGPESSSTELARRELGIAILNAEASLQRLLSESWARAGDLEPLLVLTLYLRRLHANALALFSIRQHDPAAIDGLGLAAADLLAEISDSIAAGRVPAGGARAKALEALAAPTGAPGARLVRQLAIVYDAAVRACAHGALPTSATPPR